MIEPIENQVLAHFGFQWVPLRHRTASRTNFALTLVKERCTSVGTKNPWAPQVVGAGFSPRGSNACSSLILSMARAAGMLPTKTST